MYGILNLPYRMEQLDNQIAGSLEFDLPPEFADFFWTRRYGYAELGLEVSALATKLRKHAGLPIAEVREGEWNRDQCMLEQMKKITEARAAYEARCVASLSSAPVDAGRRDTADTAIRG
jgi:hypothetical protein